MSTADSAPRSMRPSRIALGVVGAVLIAAGLIGKLPIGGGWALFLLAGLLLGCGSVLFALFALSRYGDTHRLRKLFTGTLKLGAYAYVLAVCALSGSYVHEALAGRMEWYWMVFGPCVLAALILLDAGLYRKLVRNNLPTWRRYQPYISRDRADPASLRRTLVDEVVVQRTLFHTSKIRWLRHALILWGFMAMFATELVAVVIRDALPSFGWRDIWREPGHPVRLAFAFVYDATGVMVLIGCVIALVWRIAVNRRPERKFSDTPTTLFLLFVVVSGFIVEGLRIAPTIDDPLHRWAFAGLATAYTLVAAGAVNMNSLNALWLIHVVASCAFIAYVPVMRLVHSCATPMGRLMNSQKRMLADKKRGVLSAMLIRPAPALPEPGDSSFPNLH